MSHFFIKRPIFAWVLAILIMFGGLLRHLCGLPIAPVSADRADGRSRISATYPGANAQTGENSVTKVVEQNMTGVDYLAIHVVCRHLDRRRADLDHLHQRGQCRHRPGAGAEQAAACHPVAAAGRAAAGPARGEVVVELPDGARLRLRGRQARPASDIADCRQSSINEPISRVSGVGQVQLFGAEYAMRIWLDADKLAKYNLMPGDVTAAIQAQNTQVTGRPARRSPGGRRSAAQRDDHVAEPAADHRAVQATVILRTSTSGQAVRIGDVARVELGSKSYDAVARYNGKPAAGMGISLATGANAVGDVGGREGAHQPAHGATMPPGLKVDLSL